jgi:uncharacterized membrane protein
MVITNHLFGLVQCYSEIGMCYFKDSVEVTPYFPELLFMGAVCAIIILLKVIYTYFQIEIKNKKEIYKK